MHNTLEEKKEYRIWHPVTFNEEWAACDTSVLDDISASWFRRRIVLQENSLDYVEFLEQLKREHAIETGVVERLYDLREGITETFIKEGFVQSFLTHGDTNIDENDLMNHLTDHLDAVNFIFDVVKENRPLTTGFIKELHHLTTRHQKHAEGRDQFGNKLKIDLLKGTYKIRENNPTKADGTVIKYCPPEQTASEMDNLVAIYNDLVEREVHPLIIASWFHHAFVAIHPFQDGNGRVARLLTSLIFIKFNFFPLTVNRQDKIAKYFKGLQKADVGQPQDLIQYFGEIQKRNIEKALNVKEVASTPLDEVQRILIDKIQNWKIKEEQAYKELLQTNRIAIFDYCNDRLNEFKDNLETQLSGNAEIFIKSCSFDEDNKQHYYYRQIVSHANKHDYYFNRFLPKAWLIYRIKLSEVHKYQLGITIHHFGYDESALAIGSFLEFKRSQEDEEFDTTLPLNIPPHFISLEGDIESKKKNIKKYLENAMTITLAQIASEIN